MNAETKKQRRRARTITDEKILDAANTTDAAEKVSARTGLPCSTIRWIRRVAEVLKTQPTPRLTAAPETKPTSAEREPAEPVDIEPLTRLTAPTETIDMEKLVNGERLLEIIFSEQSRPSMQWLRRQVKTKNIPYIKRGRLYFYRPSTVDAWMKQKEVLPRTMV